MVDISGLDKRDVLRALFQVAQPHNYSWLKYDADDVLPNEQADRIVREGYADYVAGRSVKVHISKRSREIDVARFNKSSGAEAGQRAIARLRRSLEKSFILGGTKEK